MTSPPAPALPAAQRAVQSSAPPTPRAPKRRTFVVAVGITAVALGTTLGYGVVSHIGRPDVLDPDAVAAEALRIVREDFALSDAANMSCPSGQRIEPGHTFVCTFTQVSHTSSVQVVVSGTDGSYVVGSARPNDGP